MGVVFFTAVVAEASIPGEAKIYVAGHNGLVGSAIMRRLNAKGYTNIVARSSAELDLTNQEAVENFFKEVRPEYVFLAAAKVGGIEANSKYPAEFCYKNLMIGTNVVHMSHKYGVKKLLNLGSSCIYPRNAPQPIKETALLTAELESTNEAYAVAKIATLSMCKYHNQQYGTNFISLMPTGLYGENDNFNMETAHLLPMLMRRFHLAKLLQNGDFDGIRKDLQKHPIGYGVDSEDIISKSPAELEAILNKLGARKGKVIVWGDGTAYRELMNSDDLADVCVYFMENAECDHNNISEWVNVTSGQDITLKELLEIIKGVVEFTGNIEYDPTKPNGTPRKLMDDGRLQAIIHGWKPKVSLKDGIKNLYDWYKVTAS
ncbi:MAG: GDP-L-fucose synthase [Holosporaceae bacterium]|nr:GDP-L-fucose synthase [Holosporaceae bacterium]